jgi:hypothetical protein
MTCFQASQDYHVNLIHTIREDLVQEVLILMVDLVQAALVLWAEVDSEEDFIHESILNKLASYFTFNNEVVLMIGILLIMLIEINRLKP